MSLCAIQVLFCTLTHILTQPSLPRIPTSLIDEKFCGLVRFNSNRKVENRMDISTIHTNNTKNMGGNTFLFHSNPIRFISVSAGSRGREDPSPPLQLAPPTPQFSAVPSSPLSPSCTLPLPTPAPQEPSLSSSTHTVPATTPFLTSLPSPSFHSLIGFFELITGPFHPSIKVNRACATTHPLLAAFL